MKRALTLAKEGEGKVNPNPLVGAVVVKEGKIIGEGYHKEFGGPHAEVFALEEAGHKAKGADLYINLEPCVSYPKKKTPPCVERIIKSGIKRVFIAMRDPHPKIRGRGIKALKEAGIKVKEGILTEEAKKLNEIYIKYITTGKPFVLLKMAMTADGKIASKVGDSRWISSKKSRQIVHKLRGKFKAVLVGINTVLQDDPQLTLRDAKGRNPLRIILDSKGKIPLSAKVLNQKTAKTVIATAEISKAKEEKLRQLGVEIWRLGENKGRISLKSLIERLAKEGIDSLMIEGGATVAYSFIEEGLVDKVIFFIAPKIIGGEAPTPVGGVGLEKIKEAFWIREVSVKMVEGDEEENVIYEGYLKELK